MRRNRELKGRSEISERGESRRVDLREQQDEMDVTVEDVETIRSTLETLEPGGTAEGADAVESSIEHAESQTIDLFEEQDERLEVVQRDGEDDEGDLRELSEAVERNLGRLSDASASLGTEAAVSEFVAAKEASLQDVDYLEVEFDKAVEAREETERLQDEYRRRVASRTGE